MFEKTYFFTAAASAAFLAASAASLAAPAASLAASTATPAAPTDDAAADAAPAAASAAAGAGAGAAAGAGATTGAGAGFAASSFLPQAARATAATMAAKTRDLFIFKILDVCRRKQFPETAKTTRTKIPVVLTGERTRALSSQPQIICRYDRGNPHCWAKPKAVTPWILQKNTIFRGPAFWLETREHF